MSKEHKTIILEKARTTEKVVRMIEAENILSFVVDRSVTKKEIREEVEKLFNVKVDSVRTHNKKNKKIGYIKLNEKDLASDVATKLGLL
jgi:large subunit ribosomal protein L23